MSAVHLRIEENGAAHLHLDNPSKLNAFTPSMLTALEDHCATLDADPTVRGVIITAKGDRAFCAGADIAAWAGLSPADFARHWVRTGHRIFDRLARLSKPTIAVVHAHAFGGGLELAAACDIRVMGSGATLALPEPQIGIVPAWSGTLRLCRLLPESVVKEMVLFGRRLDAARAQQLGFAAKVSETPLDIAMDWVGHLSTMSAYAIEVAKYQIHAAVGEDRAAMIETLGSGMIGASADKIEGVAAFAEKRPPRFSNL